MIAFLMGMFFSTQAADHVKGNGKLSTKKITIDDFNAIKFDGVIDFNYEQSESTPHIEITVDENLHPYVNIDIQDRVLTVGFKGAKVIFCKHSLGTGCPENVRFDLLFLHNSRNCSLVGQSSVLNGCIFSVG